MKKSKTYLSFFAFALSVSFLMGCGNVEPRDVEISELRMVEKKSLKQSRVKVTEIGSYSINEQQYSYTTSNEKYIDNNSNTWIINQNDNETTYLCNNYTCIFDNNSESITTYNVDNYIPDALSYNSLIDIYDSVGDINKKITAYGALYILEFSAKSYVQKHHSGTIIYGEDNILNIKITTHNGLILSTGFDYAYNLKELFGNEKKYSGSINQTFTYSGVPNIPNSVQHKMDELNSDDNPIIEVLDIEDDNYPLKLTASHNLDIECYDVDYYNLANYQFDIDGFDESHNYVPQYETFYDNDKYIIVSESNYIHVYDVFTLKRKHTLVLCRDVKEMRIKCGYGVIVFKKLFGEKTHFISLEDFSEIDVPDLSFEYDLVFAKGHIYYVEQDSEQIHSLFLYDYSSKSSTKLLEADKYTEKLYLNTYNNVLLFKIIKNNHPYIYGVDTSTSNIIYEKEFFAQSDATYDYSWDGRYLICGLYSFDSKTGDIASKNAVAYQYVLPTTFQYIYKSKTINDRYDLICCVNNQPETLLKYWIYDKAKDECAINVPHVFGGNFYCVIDNYFISITEELIMTVKQ